HRCSPGHHLTDRDLGAPPGCLGEEQREAVSRAARPSSPLAGRMRRGREPREEQRSSSAPAWHSSVSICFHSVLWLPARRSAGREVERSRPPALITLMLSAALALPACTPAGTVSHPAATRSAHGSAPASPAPAGSTSAAVLHAGAQTLIFETPLPSDSAQA